jgi:ligand-binding SRPBCC domain-containing protein
VKLATYTRSTELSASVESVFAFHSNPHNITKISPPTLRVRRVDAPESPTTGDRFTLEVAEGFGLIPMRWQEIWERVEPPTLLVDTLVSGPFKHWSHQHRFEHLAPGLTKMTDHVTFTCGWRLIDRFVLKSTFAAMFAYRHARTRAYFVESGG